jgi:hypothetical protein
MYALLFAATELLHNLSAGGVYGSVQAFAPALCTMHCPARRKGKLCAIWVALPAFLVF